MNFSNSINAFQAAVHADRIDAKADRLAAQVEKEHAMAAELRGEALSESPGVYADEIQCTTCDHVYSPAASGCPNCAAESWEASE